MLADDTARAQLALAGLGSRFLARLLDGFILLVPALLIILPFLDEDADGDPTVPLWTSYALLAIAAAYEILFIALRGQTFGKMALKVVVVRADGSGRVPSLGSSAIRYVLPAAVAGVPVPLVQLASVVIYLWAVWDPHRQGLHDKAAGTLVVRATA